ncbi:Ldh family oxidoreductase [Falsiroseomonas sp. HW251]|uniref:Ldh family oxidoreductase n=1 Tax=Falsiroseomonas sp. HW251 TaxID=3390998 RepID=UPI003D31DC2D
MTAGAKETGPGAVRVAAARIRRQILAILLAWGMPDDLAETTAEVMSETDLTGVDSHGISMLMLYERMRMAGQLRLQARPLVVRENACTALVDGGAGLGHPVGVMAMQLAVEKALAAGIGAVGVFNSHHFGAAGYYARLATERGLLAMVTSSARGVLVVPTRGAIPVLGTNPIAFAAPAGRNRPLVLDIATSTVAANKVKVYDLHGRTLPEGWVTDEAGRSVTDAAMAMDYLYRRAEGGLTPLGGTAEAGGHKGYGLALMAQILGATLTGGSFSPLRESRRSRADEPDNVGHFFMAVDPRAFRPPGAFEDDMDAMINVLHGTPPANPDQPVLVPGEPEDLARAERLRDGIPIPPALDRHVRDICARCGAAYMLQDR